MKTNRTLGIQNQAEEANSPVSSSKKRESRLNTIKTFAAKLWTTAIIAVGLLLGFEQHVSAQADVFNGEMTLPGWFPFYTMPGDPYVEVFADVVCDIVVTTDAAGGSHFLVLGFKQALNPIASGANFDYEFLGFEPHHGASPNNLTPSGLYVSTLPYTVLFIRLDPVTSEPVALIRGSGVGHVTQEGDGLTPGEVITYMEKLDWTIIPL